MSNRVVFDPKQYGETKSYVFDFASLLSSGETISTASCAATVYSGTDATPSSVISGSSSISGSQVTQKFADGVLGVTYTIICTITTSLSQTLKLSAYLTIIPGVI